MTQTLSQKFDALADFGLLNARIPEDITKNLAPNITLRRYQERAVERFLYFMTDYEQRPLPVHLLFHMATGSGKTVLMAALILDLYRSGYRHFLFFVNSAHIVEKTRANFLNVASAKYLFADRLVIDGKPTEVRDVRTFEGTSEGAINIHFTTIQALHARVQNPRENSITLEELAARPMVMISDEAHHLNVEAKTKLSRTEEDARASWEATAANIFAQHSANVLLEFTATIDMGNEGIRGKYRDKLIFDYSLRQFREDGYSKDIELRQAHLPPVGRMAQAMILSQYRRKVAEVHGLRCKPVILMKSRTIAASAANQRAFHDYVAGLTDTEVTRLHENTKHDPTLNRAMTYVLTDRAVGAGEFARELREDFARDKVLNVNKGHDAERQQIALNSLEDEHNEIRVVFAVDKLNEGWDVLNLFDIVRLYDTRDGKGQRVGRTTMQEAQLIGRGARYFPFVAPDMSDAPAERRKYDKDTAHSLRVLEQLHYHCSHNPRYIDDIKNALRETGMIDEAEREITLRVKPSFRQTDFYKAQVIWVNGREPNRRAGVNGLCDYMEETRVTYPTLMTGRVTETSAFGSVGRRTDGGENLVARTLRLSALGQHIVRFALDTNEFFHFRNLRVYFPKLRSISDFISADAYLGRLEVNVSGRACDVDDIDARQTVSIVQFVLREVERQIMSKRVEYVGTQEFTAKPVSEVIVDKTVRARREGEAGLRWAESKIEALHLIDLGSADWYVYDESIGTDQEKLFIRYIHDNAEKLKRVYDVFYLIRNERAVRLYSFDTGEAVEPDFLLILRRKGKTTETILQLFVEPKGTHLIEGEKWKEDFLSQIGGKARLGLALGERGYVVRGLPFYNSAAPQLQVFDAAFVRNCGGRRRP